MGRAMGMWPSYVIRSKDSLLEAQPLLLGLAKQSHQFQQRGWQPQTGLESLFFFELPNHSLRFYKAGVASLCHTNVPACVCDGGVDRF